MSLASIVLALALDRLLGEPSQRHPLATFGAWADWLERRLNDRRNGKVRGVIAMLLALAPVLRACE